MKRILSRLGFVSLLLAICSCNAHTQNQTQQTKTPDKQNDELRMQIEQIAAAAKGHIGVAAEVLETGESVSLNPHEHFPMQSVYKLPIGMAVLAQVDNGKLTLDQLVRVENSDFVHSGQRSPIRDKNPGGVELSLRELLRYAVSESDGTASDVLLKLVGVDAVSKYLNELGINEIMVANSEKEIGQNWETQYRNWASPAGSVQLLRSLHERRGISEASQQLLYKFMIETPTFPTRLKGLLPKTAVVAHKTGSSGTNNGITAATNDIGIVTLPNGQHVAIAVYVSDSPTDLTARERVIAEITKAVWDSVTRSKQMKTRLVLFPVLLLLLFAGCTRQKRYPHEHLQSSALEPLDKLHSVDYTLREGETLASVARQRYGHQHYYRVIKLYNHIDDEAHVPANQSLKIPDLSAILAEEGLTKVIPQEVNLILCSRAKYDKVLNQLHDHQLSEDVKQQLLEAADDLQQATQSLKVMKPGVRAAPLRMIRQLEQVMSQMRVFTDTGQFDSYGYDIDMVQQQFAFALTYAIIWAREGFK